MHIAVIRDNQLEKVVVVPERHAAPKVIDRVVPATGVSYTGPIRAPSPVQMQVPSDILLLKHLFF